MSTTAPDTHTASADSAPRVYQGRSIEELIPKIQAELGEDAIVLRRRKGLTGGIGGFFQRPFVEIEARRGHPRLDVYDEQDSTPAQLLAPAQSLASAQPPILAQPPMPAQAPMHQLTPAAPGGFGGAYVTDALAALAAADSSDGAAPIPPQPAANDGEAQPYLAEEFRELTPESLLAPRSTEPFAAALAAAEVAAGQAAAGDMRESPHRAPAAAQPFAAEPQARTPVPLAAMPAPQGRTRAAIERSLLDCGIDAELTGELIETAAAHLLPLMAQRTSLSKAVQAALRLRIPVCPPLPSASATIAFVGPGGSGKTACCAALLGAYRKRSTLPAACATILRGAVDGELALLLSPHILEPTPIGDPRASRALEIARAQGLLLLDMPPLSPADRGSIRALAALLETLRPSRVVLALPATLGARPAAQLLEALRPLRASALAITHADETDQLGVAVQAACRFGLAPEYLLDRGRTRGGLQQIDPTYLAERLLP
jgi:flagellar biosynthesis protein FlhF